MTTKGPPPSWTGPADTGEAPELPPHAFGPPPEPSLHVTRFSGGHMLGVGAGGTVLAGRDHHLARDVALKFVPGDDRRALARLRREAAILVALEHPGIVTLYDVIERPDGGLEIALRLIRGETLGARIESGRDTPAHLLEHLVRAADAIGHAHARGIVHRDVKPANIMVGAFGETQVIDWGLAGPAAERDVTPDAHPADGHASWQAHLTHDGAVLGTPRYMSPEQARGERATPASDVWALGLVLCEVLTGRPPWGERDVTAILESLRSGGRPQVPDPGTGISRAIVDVAHAALCVDPARRIPDASAFAARLRAALRAPQRPARSLIWILPVLAGLFAMIAIAIKSSPPPPPDTVPTQLRPSESTTTTASTLETLAERLLETGSPVAAAGAAVDALAQRESPHARGIVAAAITDIGAIAIDSLPSAAPPCQMLALSPSSGRRLCVNPDNLAVSAGSAAPWSLATPVLSAAFVDAGRSIVLQRPDRSIERWTSANAVQEGPPVPVDCTVALSTRDGPLVLLHASECLLVSDGRAVHWQMSRGPAIQVAALSRDGAHWVVLGKDGTLHFGTTDLSGPAVRPPDGTVPRDLRAVATPLGADTLRVAVMLLEADGIFLGTFDGELIRMTTDGTIAARAHIARGRAITSLARSGSLLGVGKLVGGPMIVDVEMFRVRATLHDDDRGAFRFIDGDTFETTSNTRTATWRGLPPLPRADGLEGLTTLAVADDALFIGHANTLRRFDSDVMDTAMSFEGRWVKHISPSPDGHALALAHPGEPGFTRVDSALFAPLRAPATFALRRVLHLEDGTVLGLPYEPLLLVLRAAAPFEWVEIALDAAIDGFARGALAALLSRNGEAIVIDFTGAPVELARCPAPGARAVGLTYDGLHFILGGIGGVALVSVEDCSERALMPTPPDQAISAIALAPDGATLAAGDTGGRLWLWELATSRLLMTTPRHDGRVGAIAFQPGDALVSLGWDGTVRTIALEYLRRNVGELSKALGLANHTR